MLFSLACRQRTINLYVWLTHYTLLISFGDFVIETVTRISTSELCEPPCIAVACFIVLLLMTKPIRQLLFTCLCSMHHERKLTDASLLKKTKAQSIQCVFFATFCLLKKQFFLPFFCPFLEFCFALIGFEVCCCNFYSTSLLQYIMLFSLLHRKVSASPQRKSLLLMPLSTFRLLKEKLFGRQQEL